MSMHVTSTLENYRQNGKEKKKKKTQVTLQQESIQHYGVVRSSSIIWPTRSPRRLMRVRVRKSAVLDFGV